MYQIEHIASGKSYIGITSGSLKQGWSLHRTCARRGDKTPLHRALRKHGFEAFDWRSLHEVDTFEEAKAIEVRLIAGGLGHYNATSGGDGTRGMRHSTETRARMSERAKSKGQRPPPDVGTAAALEVHRGAKRSPEWRRAISAGLRAHCRSDDPVLAEQRKAASKARMREYYLAHRDEILARQAATYVAHPRPRKTAAQLREYARRKTAQWRGANPEGSAAAQARSNANRRERRRLARG